MPVAPKAPTTVPVKVVTPRQVKQQAAAGFPTLPGGKSAAQYMAGLTGIDWMKQARGALNPSYDAGLEALKFALTKGIADARANATALQGAYTAAGGAMPHVGSEYTALGSAMGDLANVVGAGLGPISYADHLNNVGITGAVPPAPNTAAVAALGTAPARSLAESGWYKDLGLKSTAEAMQMQGREQAMALQNKLQGNALAEYMQGSKELTADMLSKVPSTAIALSGEARARRAGVLSGYQFDTEHAMNVQDLLMKYAQMRAEATTNGQKMALDTWVQQQLNYRATQSKKKAGAGALTVRDRRYLTSDLDKWTTGTPGNKTWDSATKSWRTEPGSGTKPLDYGDVVNKLMSSYGLTRKQAMAYANQRYQPGQHGRPYPVTPPKGTIPLDADEVVDPNTRSVYKLVNGMWINTPPPKGAQITTDDGTFTWTGSDWVKG